MTDEMTALGEELTGVVRAEVEELRVALRRELQAGREPTEARVAELETRLAEAEARLGEAEERLRLELASPQLPSEEAAAFRGAFLRDGEALRKRIRELRLGESTRSIDSSLFTSGGKLSAETAERFIQMIADKQVALSRVQLRRMSSPDGHTDELTVVNRKLRKGAEGEAPPPAGAVGTRRRSLSTVEVVWAEDITLTFLEDNIERHDAEATIAGMLARAFGNDANDLAWNGDESESADDFLSINDGWLALAAADGEVNGIDLTDPAFDADGDTPARQILAWTLAQLPPRYKGRADLAFFVPVAFAERYAEETATRQTALGDQVLVGGFPALRYFGIPVVAEPHLTGASGQRLLLTPTGNLFFAVQRQVTVDGQWQPRKRVVEYTLTARTDYQYAAGEALVLVDNLPSS